MLILETKELKCNAQRTQTMRLHILKICLHAEGIYCESICTDNNMFLLNCCSFYERKTGHLEKYFLCEHRKVQGMFALVCQAPKPILDTQHARKRGSKWYPSLIQLLRPIPNKAMEQAPFLLPLQNVFIFRLCPALLSISKSHHCDIADSRTRFYLHFLSRFVLFDAKT